SAAIRSTWHKWTYGSCSALIIGVLATFISGQITLARTVITTVTCVLIIFLVFAYRYKKTEIAQFNNNLMLQDEEDDPLMRALGLNAFYNFDLKSTDLDFKSTQVEEDANIVC
ncbi:unnamed protein product, partial [Rotaria socialis]